MGVSFKKGTFTKATTVTTQDITDVGFQPKALIIWTSNQTVETFEEHAMLSYGFSDGTNDCVVTHRSEDNSGTSDTDSNIYNDAIIQIINASTSGAEEARATLSSFLVNGFRLDWAVNAAPAAVCHYVAIGGTDITNVKVGTQTVGTTTTGNKAYTGAGFQPDFLLTINDGALPGAGAYTFNTTIEAHAGFGISAMKSTTARWAFSTVSENAAGIADTWNYQSETDCFTYFDNTTGTKLLEADFTSFDTDGWTWNYGTNTTANNQNAVYAYLAIKGGVWDVGRFSEPTTNTTVLTNTDASATLKGAMSHHCHNTNPESINSHNAVGIGGSDGTNQGCLTFFDFDGQTNMVVTRIQNDDMFVYMMFSNATATSSTVTGTCTVTFATSSFTTTWSSVDGSARRVHYWAVSESTGAVAVAEDIFPHSYGKIHQMYDNNTGPALFG